MLSAEHNVIEKVVTDCDAKVSSWPVGSRERLVAVIANAAMLLYVYFHYLAGVEWGKFGLGHTPTVGGFGSNASNSDSDPSYVHRLERLVDYILLGHHDEAFEKLRVFTFSQAMSDHLFLFFTVGSVVAAVLFYLERKRVRWLQRRLCSILPTKEAELATRKLQLYLRLFYATLVSILLLAPFHIDHPRAHYAMVAVTLTFGVACMSTYLALPIDLEELSKASDPTVAAWARRTADHVRPTLKFVLGMHVASAATAIIKSETMNDDRAALLFGIVETVTILSYQLFVAVFVADDVMIKREVLTSLEN
jgi:hypothetical protein